MDVRAAAERFAADLKRVLDISLPGDHPIVAEERGERYIVHRQRATDGKDGQPMPVLFGGKALARLTVRYQCSEDREDRYLVVNSSEFALSSEADNNPLVRLEFEHLSYPGKPAAHWHFHAERGAFSVLLAVRSDRKAHSLASLHFPVGGFRMRPCLEDFIEFLIRECGADAHPAWEQAVADGRERWRKLQLASLVRDAPENVAEWLTRRGYTVTPPESGPPPGKPEAFRTW